MGPWEVWTSLAALAAVTSRVELGPFVASTGFHAPAMLAKMAATVDAISGGRLILGLGAGWNEREYTAFGFPFDHRVSRFEEAFTIIRDAAARRAASTSTALLRRRRLRPRPGARPPRRPAAHARLDRPADDADRRSRMRTCGTCGGATTATRPAGFARLRERVETAAAAPDAGAGRGRRDRGGARPARRRCGEGDGRLELRVGRAPVPGEAAAIADHLEAMAAAGAVHVQLVLDPITVDSIATVAEAVAMLDQG